MKVYIIFQHVIGSLVVVGVYKNEKDAANDFDQIAIGSDKSNFFIEEYEVIE